MTKKLVKALAATLCALVLIVGTIAGTVAYLTSKAEVQNTFTAGKVAIKMDEAKVDEYGVEVTGEGAGRVTSNTYKLVPGRTYDIDLTIHVEAGSEACYLFVQIDADFLAVASTVTNTLDTNDWEPLTGVANVYYKEIPAVPAAEANDDADYADYKVFEEFTVNENETNSTLSQKINPANNPAKVVAYAIQKDGIADVATAWTTVSTLATS